MKLLEKAFSEGYFILDVEAAGMRSIVRQTLEQLASRGQIPADRSEAIEEALMGREEQASTAIGNAVAVPHAYLDILSEQIIVFVRLASPVNLGAPDGVPTHFVFLLLGPPGKAAQHLDTLMHIARLMSDDTFRYDAGEATGQADLSAALRRFLVRTAIPQAPAAKPTTPGLRYNGGLFRGVMNDIRRRAAWYVDDFRDGLHSKCAGSTLFLFFACLAPAVTFGGVMALATDGQIGAVEMIVASAMCGVVYALFSGQPLIILGGTGPLLIFTIILYSLCKQFEIPFLATYAWIGLWSMLLLIVLAATEASCLMRFFTRFTDEIFAALISLIFIYEAVMALVHVFTDHEVSHDTALLSLLLALGTFYVAMNLSRFRRSRYLLPGIREFLADFGPAIALSAMTIVAVLLHEVELGKLPTPASFGTTAGRPWRVNLFEAPVWVWWGAAAPAVLVAVLVFLDQNITARLVNNPDHKLYKGEAYHLDLGLVGVLMGVCSLFGMPWLVAATVRSLNHVRSLATVEEVVSANGETRERVLHVRENRVTGLSIHLLLGFSLLLLPLLRVIPMAVLYGLFLFMGVVSMAGNQFFERLSLWAMDRSLYPSTHYTRRVPRWTIHKFTMLQAVCLGVLWLVKASAFGILFPLFIALLVPVRLIAGRYFSAEHLAALDADEEPEEEEMVWV